MQKSESKNLDKDVYETNVYSFTKAREYSVKVSKKYINKGENILIVDDFGKWKSCLGLKDLIEQAEANLVGVGIVIEKGFQAGGALLKANDVRLESLAVVESIDNGTVKFR